MAHTSSLVFAGIAPHPPIMVPEVGRDAIAEVRSSIDGMADLTRRVLESGAETVVLISPHAPLQAAAFVAYDGPILRGDFSMFRAADTTVEAELDHELLMEIARAGEQHDLITLRITRAELDHGTAVPLYFLQRNGFQGKVVALGYSFLSNEDHLRFGNCIRAAIAAVRRPVAFIASGDLSHRLKPGAPAGYNPEAHLFDEEVVDAIRSCKTSRIVNIDPELRRTAGECGYRSMLVVIGATEGLDAACEVISYEAPFGVGYLVAQLVRYAGEVSEPGADRGLHAGSPRGVVDATGSGNNSIDNAPSSSAQSMMMRDPDVTRAIPALARLTIETFVTTGTVISPPEGLEDQFLVRAGCFVSLKTLDGDLRGCIGTIDPVKDTLAEEIIWNAVSATTRDPRFQPVHIGELPNLKYSVDVLSAPEPCTADDLDPEIYGVIVEDESGFRRGLLLPNLEGITSAARQVEIAAQKAGIAPGTPVKLSRFRADRYSE